MMEDIIDIVCEHFDIPRTSLSKKTKCRAVVYPRQVAMYFLARRWSYAAVAESLGMKQHGTVGHAVKTIENLLTYREGTIEDVARISREIQKKEIMDELDKLSEDTFSRIALCFCFKEEEDNGNTKELIKSVITNALLKAQAIGFDQALATVKGFKK